MCKLCLDTMSTLLSLIRLLFTFNYILTDKLKSLIKEAREEYLFFFWAFSSVTSEEKNKKRGVLYFF